MMLILFIFVAIMLAVADATCMGHLHRRSVDNYTVEVSRFGYTGQIGPLLWQTLAAANSICEKGENQSPINIDASIKQAATHPKVTFAKIETASFENLGTTVEVIANGTTQFGNKMFNLKQFHFHSPSEHRIDEEYFPLEMHMVHEAADGTLIVLALLFDISSTTTTPLLTTLSTLLPKISTPGSLIQAGPLNLSSITTHLETTPLRQYSGSLTTPPCTQGITFLVAENPLPVDAVGFNAMKKVLKFNSRFTQGALGEANLIEKAVRGAK